jgi:hypothetical protein
MDTVTWTDVGEMLDKVFFCFDLFLLVTKVKGKSGFLVEEWIYTTGAGRKKVEEGRRQLS